MSKFRARALDASKPMPIFMTEDIPDLPEYSAINRSVPQMPSGMEKEEESEHHLQRAICAGVIIPTPEVQDIKDLEEYDRIYPATYKASRQLIHMQPFTMEQDIPDYDMDSEDERWINAQSKKLELSPLKFEEMLDRLEKNSGQSVVTLGEAKSLLKEDDDLIIAVYDYWLEKRLKTQRPLIPTVKTESRSGAAANNNPYIAFRRRTEKMQTRKNRKNDETSYEKMLKLRRDLSRAVTLLEMVKRREKAKREMLFLTVEIYEKRYQAGDFSGQLLSEVSSLKNYQQSRPAFAPIYPNQYSISPWANKVHIKDEVVPRKEKRQYKKRKHKGGSSICGLGGSSTARGGLDGYLGAQGSSEEESSSAGLRAASPAQPTAEAEDEDEGPFAFRRNPACNYHAPLPGGFGNYPWCSQDEGGSGDRRYRFCLTSINRPKPRCVGFARRRIGRGGRVILDREPTQLDDIWRSLDFSVFDSHSSTSTSSTTNENNNEQLFNEIKNDWLHFRPKMDDTDAAVLEDVADPTLLDRRGRCGRGRVALEVESVVVDGDKDTSRPFSTVVELDLDQLNSDDLFPTLGDLSSLSSEDYFDDSNTRKRKLSSVRTSDGNGFHDGEGDAASSPARKRPLLDGASVSSLCYSESVPSISAFQLTSIKHEKDVGYTDQIRTDQAHQVLKIGSETNGPSQEVVVCGENGDIKSNSPTSSGCSAIFRCDSSSSQSNGESLHSKSLLLPVQAPQGPPPPYPSSSSHQHWSAGNGNWSNRNTGSVVVLNHSDGVNSSSGIKVHRSSAGPTVLVTNGPLHSTPSTEYLIAGVRPSTSLAFNRKIAAVQKARTSTMTAPATATNTVLIQPSCSSVVQPVTPTIAASAQNHTSRANTLNSEKTSDEVCSDQKQLVCESNTLPMEVT